MVRTSRRVLRSKNHRILPDLRGQIQEIVPPDEDRRIETGIYDALLPCRSYEIAYKVAVLGKVSPSLEFLLRLLKTAPGLSEESAALFFGYTRAEIAYVLKEAQNPGYVTQRNGRLWLTVAGEGLFKIGEEEPTIFSVENRCRSFGFDLLAVAPQATRARDLIELTLPELPIPNDAITGKVADRIPERFRRFFYELSDRSDREQIKRRDLYSIDGVIPKDRFQSPVRIHTFAQASSPSVPEIDLSSWRPDHELADRAQVENSAAEFIEGLKITLHKLIVDAAYQALVDLAPEFLRERVIANRLDVNRYWRAAIMQMGEPRSDRKTIPIVGPLYTRENATRLLRVLEYGLREKAEPPRFLFTIAPQTKLWGATTQHSEVLTALKRKIITHATPVPHDVKSICLLTGYLPPYVERTFDEIHQCENAEFSPALELMIIPNVAMAALLHAPIGAPSGQPVALGLTSFDPEVVARAQSMLKDRLGRFVKEDALYRQYVDALNCNGQREGISLAPK
jgi:hypothetical protein